MKNKQGIGLVVAVVALGASAVIYMSGGGAGETIVPDSIELVCVKTGQVFHVKRRDISMLPGVNPETGTQTLLPCYRRDDVLYVNERFAGDLTGFLESENNYVDPQTLAVKPKE